MSLNFSCDCPACNPSASSNETSIVGPSFDSVSQASQMPIATAINGITQIIEIRRRLDVRAMESGSVMATYILFHRKYLYVHWPSGGTTQSERVSRHPHYLSKSILFC